MGICELHRLMHKASLFKFLQASKPSMPITTLPKAVLLILIMRICIQNSLAQDTTSITFTEEAITVKEQRFIDRYETAFMTKVPTR